MILVTGAGGWLGSELTKQLLEQGNTVRALNNIETFNLTKLKEKYNDKLEIVLGDICDEDCLNKSINGVEKVFHLAAKVHCVPTNKDEEENFYKINTLASEKIFEKCLENSVKRVIFFSTVSVYGTSDKEISTTSPKNPNTVYGKSKLKAEEIANKLYKQKGLPITIIEPVTVYGEGDVGNFAKLEKMIKKGLCVKFGNGTNKKTVIYYKDLIRMTIKIANEDEQIGKTIICGTEVLSINDINNILIEKTKKHVVKITIPTAISNMAKNVCNVSKLKKVKRKIMALEQNNEFKIEYKIDNITKFREYEINASKKENILIMSSEYPDVRKSSNIYTDLAEALKEDGYKVSVVVTEESKNIKKTAVINEKGIEVLRVKVGNIYNIGLIEKGFTFLKSGFLVKHSISKYFKDRNFDLILFMSQPVTLAKTVRWAMKKYNCKSYLMMKDIFPQNGVDIGIISKKSPIYIYFKHQEKILYKTASMIGCMSEMNIKYLLEHNSYLKKEKLELFPNTQKIEEKDSNNTSYLLRKKYNIPTDKVLAVYGGNIGKPQGVEFFMEVLKEYKNNNKINFLILARGTEKEKLYKFIDDEKIENVYKFDLLPRNDYQQIVSECDIGLIFLNKKFTIPNYPSKVLAYFNLSIPVMAAIDKNNDFKDMLENTHSGFWSEAGNINSYKEKMDKLIGDKELRQKMGQSGRATLEKQFSVNRSVEIINKYLSSEKKG